MASDDDKTTSRNSDDEDRPSGGRRKGSSATPSGRSDPSAKEPSIKGKAAGGDEGRRRPHGGAKSAGGSVDERPEDERPEDERPDAEPEAPRRRFGFLRRSGGARDDHVGDSGRRVASLRGDDPAEDDFDDDLDDLPEPPRFRWPPWWAIAGGLILLVVVSLVLYGELNTERYFLVCSGSRAEAHRGRGFPWPFGHEAMVGSQYRAVPLGGDAQCQTQELDSEAELQHSLLKLLIVEAERLSHKTRSADLARARQMIGQGFGLARNYKKERRQLEVLRATLDFQRARVVMRELETTLGEARRLFSRAQGQSKPYRKESAAWIRVLDRMLVLLRRRIAGDPEQPRRVGAPPAPVKPGAMSATPDRPVVPAPRRVSPDAMGSSATPNPPPRRVSPTPGALPDAGVSGGGILL